MRVLHADNAPKAKAAAKLEKSAKSGIIGANRAKGTPEMPKAAAVNRITPIDVTEEYLDAAAPGQGAVTYDNGYKTKGHQAEIDMAHSLHRAFGGDIKLLAESKEQGDKTPDFLWNGRCWELKGVTSKSSIDRAVREAAKQIRTIPGGIILDISASGLSIEEIEAAIVQRIPRVALDSMDAMLIAKQRLEKVLRYKK